MREEKIVEKLTIFQKFHYVCSFKGLRVYLPYFLVGNVT